jgi:predicted transcriptional regulator of viral defense system
MKNENRVLEITRKNGQIETKEVVNKNIRKEVLSKLIEKGLLERVDRGLYITSESIPDEYSIIQKKCRQGIFSHETALYFWDLSDRVPGDYHLTVPSGYNVSHITAKYSNIVFHYIKPEFLNLGITSKKTPFGQKVNVYDRERTICDIVKNKSNMDTQIFSDAMKRYFKNKKIDLRKLYKYAEVLGVEEKLRIYAEVLL